MRRPTSVWTDGWPRLAVLVGLVCAGSLAGPEPPPIRIGMATCLGLGVVVALALDVWGGLVAGMAAAAGMVALRQYSGQWAPDDFGLAVAEVVLIVVASTWAGLTGQHLRTSTPDATGPEPIQPPYASLGLLDPEATQARLSEEVAARARDRASLGLALFDVRTLVDDVPADVDRAAHRAVARQLAARTGQLDVPFALTTDRLGVIFPHSTGALAWDTVGRVLEGIRGATITVGPDRRNVALPDLVAVSVGISEQPASTVSVAGLLGAARTALEHASASDQP